MELRQRLSTLRGRVPADAGGSGELAARIERLRLRRTCPAEVRDKDDHALAREVGGRVAAPGLIRIDKVIDVAGYRSADGLAAAAITPVEGVAGDRINPQRLLFLDTETTGLAGGSGTLVFLLGLARLRGDRLQLCQYLLTRFSGERAMLRQAAAAIRADDVLVSYNGKCFDLPLLHTRFRLAGVANPLPGLSHLDLLHPVRRAFSRAWPNCRLLTLEQRLLNFYRQDDLPGAEAPAAWLGWLRHGERCRLVRVCDHNRWDILTLARLQPMLPQSSGPPPASRDHVTGRMPPANLSLNLGDLI